MPKVYDAGYSSCTYQKQADFRKFLNMHMRIVYMIIRKYPKSRRICPKYLYIDMNAGPGIYQDGNRMLKGSPIIFLEEAEFLLKNGIEYEAVFMDTNQDAIDNLKRVIGVNDRTEILCTDNANCLEMFRSLSLKTVYGIVYADPNGIPNFKLISQMSRQREFNTVDFVINCNSTAIKRVANSSKCSETKRLEDYLSSVNKRYWLCREPEGRFQWSLLVGTQWNMLPKIDKLRFHWIFEQSGKQVFEKINLTSQEIKKKHLTEAMQNTCKRPNSEKSDRRFLTGQMAFVKNVIMPTQQMLTI